MRKNGYQLKSEDYCVVHIKADKLAKLKYEKNACKHEKDLRKYQTLDKRKPTVFCCITKRVTILVIHDILNLIFELFNSITFRTLILILNKIIKCAQQTNNIMKQKEREVRIYTKNYKKYLRM